MRHIPSLKTLRAAFMQQLEHDYPDPEKRVRQLRKLLEGWRDGTLSYTSMVHSPSRYMLQLANDILQGHGIEHVESANGRAEAYYVNMGDTYTATILLDTKRSTVLATSWGDWVEKEERAGNRFD